MRERIEPVGSLVDVVDDGRRYDEKCADRARAELRAYVNEAGGETRAAERLGKAEALGRSMNQSTVNRSLDPNKQPSLRVLIALSRATGRSLDEILGLRVPAVSPPTAAEIAKELAKELKSTSTVPPSTTEVRPIPPTRRAGK